MPQTWVQSFTSIGIREDLTDKLIRTGDGEAPFLSSLQKKSSVAANATKHEWQDWALPVPTANAAIEGFTPTVATVARNRRSNQVQIFQKAFDVADSVLEGTRIAGLESEYQFHAAASFTALRRDIEWQFMNVTASVTGTSAVAAQLMGPFGAITTNVSIPASASSVFTESEVLTSFRQIFAQRGVFSNLSIFAAPKDVTTIMGFTGPGTSGKFLMVNDNTTTHNRQVSVIICNFGKAAVVPSNQVAGTGRMLLADMSTWCLAVKVAPKLKAIAKVKDSTSAYWKTELTLEWLNQSGNAQMSGLITATA